LLQRPALELSVEKRQPKQRTFSKEKMAETNKHGSYAGLKAKTSCWTYYIVAMKKPRRWLHLVQLSLPCCLMWWIRHSKPNRLWGEKNPIEAIYIKLSGTFFRPLDWLWKCVKLLKDYILASILWDFLKIFLRALLTSAYASESFKEYSTNLVRY
jgi:hypothetical protein